MNRFIFGFMLYLWCIGLYQSSHVIARAAMVAKHKYIYWDKTPRHWSEAILTRYSTTFHCFTWIAWRCLYRSNAHTIHHIHRIHGYVSRHPCWFSLLMYAHPYETDLALSAPAYSPISVLRSLCWYLGGSSVRRRIQACQPASCLISKTTCIPSNYIWNETNENAHEIAC